VLGKHSRLRDLGVTDVNRAETLQALGRAGEAQRTMAMAVAGLRKAADADTSNRRWRAEALHAQAGLILMQLDAGLPVELELIELQRELKQAEAAPSMDLRLQLQARVASAQAELAARRGEWLHVKASVAEAERSVADLLHHSPGSWRASEMGARLGLLGMRMHAALGDANELIESCARTRDRLQTAVDAGLGGLGMEAWLRARTCSRREIVDRAALRRLTTGGYRPMDVSLLGPSNSAREIP
jgi:hypothetical protein